LLPNKTFSQSGQKWATGGNNISTNNFLGTTNNRPLLFKVNNALALQINVGGSVLFNSLANNGNGIVSFDNSGKLIPTSFPNDATKVLLGNGTWGNVPIPQNYWQLNGTNLYTTTPGYVGIGTSNPQFTLDVDGEVRITQNLYVGGGIIITDKVNAATQIATNKMQAVSVRADSIVMDSTKAVYGQANFAGDVKLANKLRVDGDVQVNGDFKTAGSLTFASNKTIGFIPGNSNNNNILYFGNRPDIGLETDQCFTPPLTQQTINLFKGMIQTYDTSTFGGNINILSMGFDGSNGRIEMSGTSNQPTTAPRLLINYKCGKDIFMNTGDNGGNIMLTSSGKVGIGIQPDANSPKLSVHGDVSISSLASNAGETNLIQVDQNGLLSKIPSASAGIGLWLQNGSYIYNANTGNVGIGTNNPRTTLHLYSSSSTNCETALRIENNFTGTPDGCVGGNNAWDIKSSSNNGKNLLFSSVSNSVPVMLLTSDGKVSIGTNTDFSEKLNVFGYGKFFSDSGNVTIGFNGAHGYLNCSDALLINYYTGNDVVVGSDGSQSNHSSSGNLYALHNAYFATINGSVGIGTTTPSEKLTVSDGNILIKGVNNFSNGGDSATLYLGDNYHYIRSINGGGLRIGTYLAPDAIMLMQGNGSVGIGTANIPTGYKFAVNGNILCEKVKVINNVPTADFVFENKYQLNSLNDVEKFIKENKHLPDVPSAEEMKKNGLDLADMNILLLKKIEELTLYLIEQDKEIEVVNNKLKTLEKNQLK